MMQAFDKVVRIANVVKVVLRCVRDDDISEVLRDVTLEFISSGIADLDCQAIGRMFDALQEEKA